MKAPQRHSQHTSAEATGDRNYSNVKLAGKPLNLNSNFTCLGIRPDRLAAIRRKASAAQDADHRLAKLSRSAMTLTI
jgi:hypothetical protein